MTILHALIGFAVSLVVGAGAGYGFRGKINKGIKSAGSAVGSAASDVAKKV